MNQTAIGQYIAQKRKEKNLTQAQLGEKLGVSNKAISKWENGKCMPDYSIIHSLCDALNITVAELLDGKNTPQDRVRVYGDEQTLDFLERKQVLKGQIKKVSGSAALRAVQVVFLIGLVLMALVSVDLGINAVAAGIPELQDETSYYSFLQSEFGLLEDMGIRHRDDFFYAFKTSLWITFILFAVNVVLFLWKRRSSLSVV